MIRLTFAKTLLLLMPLLVSCSYTRAPQGPSPEQAIIAEQRKLLGKQGEQLESLVVQQQDITAQLQTLQQQLADVHTVVTRNDEPAVAIVHIDENKTPKLEPKTPKLSDAKAPRDNKLIIGRVEWMWLDIAEQRFKARIDTGATSSSLSATDIQPFERNGKKWVRFRIPAMDTDPLLETPLIRYKKIRQSSVEELDKRPVVQLMVRMGEINEEVQFNLTDRENMIYPILLGRNFLRDIAIVDVAQKFTQPKVELVLP